MDEYDRIAVEKLGMTPEEWAPVKAATREIYRRDPEACDMYLAAARACIERRKGGGAVEAGSGSRCPA